MFERNLNDFLDGQEYFEYNGIIRINYLNKSVHKTSSSFIV